MTARLPRTVVDAAALAALGALQTLAYSRTAALWWLPAVAIAVLWWRLDVVGRQRVVVAATTPGASARAGVGRAALLGWAYATGWLAAGTWWLFISLHRYGNLAAPLAALAVLALAAALALYVAAAAAAYVRWRRGRARDALLFAALWLVAELARGVVFTGFPWLASGYSQVDSPLAVLAPWVGVYGIGAVLAYVAAALARSVTARDAKSGVAAVLAVVGCALAPRADWTASTGALDVALLQTRVDQADKFDAERMPQTLSWLAHALLKVDADLVVAPETAVPLLPAQLDALAPGYWDALRAPFVAATGRGALVGVPLGDAERGYTNSVAGFVAGGDYRYDKHHLVPFGEFIPLGFRWFTDALRIPLGDFARGGVNPPSLVIAGQRVAPNICFEDLFGEELARRFVDARTAPTVLANVSNLGWFGDTAVTVQHLNISRLRAIELQRPMVRATNTGATATIDHAGRVTAQLDPTVRGVLRARVDGRHGTTPFAAWAGRAGLWPLAALALLVALVAAWPRRRDAVASPRSAA